MQVKKDDERVGQVSEQERPRKWNWKVVSEKKGVRYIYYPSIPGGW